MIDKERLGEIKEKYSEVTVLEYINDVEIVGVDIKDLVWLINRVEELELELNDWRAEVHKWQQFYKESEESHLETKKLLKNIVNQNKRLREAIIEAIADIEEISPHEAKKTLREALNNGEN
jgi:archaellum biogenesis ATPase FlaH